VAHMEKNWGDGFPDSWTWMQAFSPPQSEQQTSSESRSTLALAGGTTGVLGIKSYLVIYRSPSTGIQWDFASPWTDLLTVSNRSRGLFLKERINQDEAEAEIDVSSLTRRLSVRAESSEDVHNWVPFDCPLISGHGNVTARETFLASIDVKAYTRSPWMIWNPYGWKLIERRAFSNAAFELGGGYRTKTMLELDRQLEREGNHNAL